MRKEITEQEYMKARKKAFFISITNSKQELFKTRTPTNDGYIETTYIREGDNYYKKGIDI